MDFALTHEQVLLRDSLQTFLRQQYGFAARQAALHSLEGRRADIWKRFAELGILGAAFPERVGGLGGGAAETMIVMQAFGSALVFEPYLEACVIAGGLLSRAGGSRADEALDSIAKGESLIVPAWAETATHFGFERVCTRATRDDRGWVLSGRKIVVIAAPWATQLLVSARTGGADDDRDGISLFLIDKSAAGIRLLEYPTMDGRRAADVIFDGVRVSNDSLIGEVGGALASLERAGDEAIAAISAEAVGILKRMLADTLDYAKQRKQFGQTIASFQVLQHRMVDMHLQIEMAESASYRATLSLDAEPRERMLAASAAKVVIAEACRFVSQNAVQLHGGVGMTEELALGSYFKRAMMIVNEFGSADHHLARHARLEAAA